MQDIFKVNPESVKEIQWTGDHIEYDLELFSLGPQDEPFIVLNPWNEDSKYYHYVNEIPDTDKCAVFKYKDNWVAKYFPKEWDPDNGYEEIIIADPKFVWRKNPDLDRTMTFEDDPFSVFKPEPWDGQYQLVWYMDPRFNPLPDKVWAVSCQPVGRPSKGIKDMGYVTPKVDIEFNEEAPDVEIDIDTLCPAYWDLAHECVYQLDPIHCPDKEIWLVKFTPSYRKAKEWKWYGTITPEFKIEYNPDLLNMDYDLDYIVPWHDLGYTHVWNLDRIHLVNGEPDMWAFKIITHSQSRGEKFMGEISPSVTIEFNSDLSKMDYGLDYVIPWHDFKFEHLWLLDKKHYPDLDYDIWAIKVYYSSDITGIKTVGSVSPQLTYKFNPDLPKLDYSIDYVIPYYDLKYSHTWMLNEKHTKTLPEPMWAVEISAVKKPQGNKTMAKVSPIAVTTINNEIGKYTFPKNLVDHVQYHDFKYTNTWMLSDEHSLGFDIWAVKLNFTKDPKGNKNQGSISPGYAIETNPDLGYLDFTLDYQIPYHDAEYIHVWYLDPEYSNGEKIWAARAYTSKKSKGEKEMGYIIPEFPKHLDVIFISYGESNAEENWRRLLTKAPWAKRVNGVKGIFEAHKAASELAKSDMFYVVDADAWLVDDFNFNYQPGIFDRDCAYIWYSQNPVTDITYGYGGVKLFSKSMFADLKTWKTLDLATSMPKVKVISKVSNITKFNVDEFSTWRSSFRECVKLCYNINKQPDDPSHSLRLKKWKKANTDQHYGVFAAHAAHCAEQFFKENFGTAEITKINDRDWLLEKFYYYNPDLRKKT